MSPVFDGLKRLFKQSRIVKIALVGPDIKLYPEPFQGLLNLFQHDFFPAFGTTVYGFIGFFRIQVDFLGDGIRQIQYIFAMITVFRENEGRILFLLQAGPKWIHPGF